MKTVQNKFGKGDLYDADDLGVSIYCACTACMSIWSDFLSWANYERSKRGDGRLVTPKFIKDDNEFGYVPTDTIVVLGCQVTDLAVYNDLKIAEELHNEHPNTPIYMGGCLAQRFDIELPEYIKRLNVVRVPYQDIEDVVDIIDYRPPFWNKSLAEDEEDEMVCGNLFRHCYPLKIGAGCHGKCEYCTIRDTRGESYETDAYLQIREFLSHTDVVLISDSPTVKQIKDWCHIAERYSKEISLRNVEPQVAMSCKKELSRLSGKKLLRVLHCPIQSSDDTVLAAMNRSIKPTQEFILFAQDLRKNGTKVATNIIIDYVIDDAVVRNMDEEYLNEHFDYWSWNPYFDGKWNYEDAAERFKRYIG